MKPLFLLLFAISLLGCYSLKKASTDQIQTKQTLEEHHDINQVIDTTKTNFSKVTVTEVDYVTIPRGETVLSDTVKVPVTISYLGSVPLHFKQITYQKESKQNGLANNQELIDTKEKNKANAIQTNQLDTSFSLVELLLAGGIIIAIMVSLYFIIKTRFPGIKI